MRAPRNRCKHTPRAPLRFTQSLCEDYLSGNSNTDTHSQSASSSQTTSMATRCRFVIVRSKNNNNNNNNTQQHKNGIVTNRSKANVIIANASHRKALVRSWNLIPERLCLVSDALCTVFRREPALKTLFAFRNIPTGGALRHDDRFQRHASAFLLFYEDVMQLLDSNQQKAIADMSQRLGRRHATLLAGRCRQVKGDWWTCFSAALFDTMVPHIGSGSRPGSNLLILWHIFVTKIAENVAMGFLAAHMDHNSNVTSLSGTGKQLAMPTIYEGEDDDSCIDLLANSGNMHTSRSLDMRSHTNIKSNCNHGNHRYVKHQQNRISGYGCRSEPRKPLVPSRDSNNNDTPPVSELQPIAVVHDNKNNNNNNNNNCKQPTTPTTTSTNWLTRMSQRLNPFRSKSSTRVLETQADQKILVVMPETLQLQKLIETSSPDENSSPVLERDCSTLSVRSEPPLGLSGNNKDLISLIDQEEQEVTADVSLSSMLASCVSSKTTSSTELTEEDEQNNNSIATVAPLQKLEEWDQLTDTSSSLLFNKQPAPALAVQQQQHQLSAQTSTSTNFTMPLNAHQPQSIIRESPCKLSDRTLEVKAWELRHNAQRMAGTQGAERHRAIYHYKPNSANKDELELRQGDIVEVVEKCDDGWYIGSSLRTNQFGTFPGNYVMAMNPM